MEEVIEKDTKNSVQWNKEETSKKRINKPISLQSITTEEEERTTSHDKELDREASKELIKKSPVTVSFWLLPPVCAPQVTVVIKLEVASTAEAFTKTLAIIEFSGLAEEVL